MGLKILKPPSKNTIFAISGCGKCSKQRVKHGTLLVGREKRIFQSVIKFDINALPPSLTIASAILKVYLFQNDCSAGPKTVSVHQVLSPCAQGKNLIFKSPPVASAVIGKKNNTFISFDITPLFIDWYRGSSANQGLLLSLSNEMNQCLLGFRSKEFGDSRVWPSLEISYQDHYPAEKSCCQILTVDENAITGNMLQTTSALSVQQFNYTYYIINTGTHSATVSLQLSPDNANWLTDQPLQVVAPGGILPLVPNLIASYARLTFQATVPGQNTSLAIRVRGSSA